MEITFGTDGWRGIINKDFTFENLAIVSQGIADYYNKEITDNCKVFVGYDTRLNSFEYAKKTTVILLNNGIKAILAENPITTPMLSFAVKNYRGIGGVMITASHNPPEFNGVKLKGPYGGSATPEIINNIEKYLYKNKPRDSETKIIERFDPYPDYVNHLKTIVDFNKISNYRNPIIIDPMYGAATGYLLSLLTDLGLNAKEIHSAPNHNFGGINPEPIEPNLEDLMTQIKTLECGLGIALDGDGDRFGLVDELGKYINSHQIYTMLLKYLIESKGWLGGVVKTFSTTDVISKIANKYKLPIYETPIGFKYICNHFLKEDILMGGEESGGFGFKNHIPERDGILTGLLLLESLSQGNITEKIKAITNEFGDFYYNRLDIKVPSDIIKEVFSNIISNPPRRLSDLEVKTIETLDGVKLRINNGWLLLRPSGTEPLVRIYTEADNPTKINLLSEWGKNIFTSNYK